MTFTKTFTKFLRSSIVRISKESKMTSLSSLICPLELRFNTQEFSTR